MYVGGEAQIGLGSGGYDISRYIPTKRKNALLKENGFIISGVKIKMKRCI